MNKQQGFTLIELMATVALMGAFVVAFLFFARCALSGGSNREAAMQNATTWTTRMGLVNTAVDCGTAMYGKRGMVPCTVAVRMGGPVPAIYGLECAGVVNMRGEEGCRITSAPVMTPAVTQ